MGKMQNIIALEVLTAVSENGFFLDELVMRVSTTAGMARSTFCPGYAC